MACAKGGRGAKRKASTTQPRDAPAKGSRTLNSESAGTAAAAAGGTASVACPSNSTPIASSSTAVPCDEWEGVVKVQWFNFIDSELTAVLNDQNKMRAHLLATIDEEKSLADNAVAGWDRAVEALAKDQWLRLPKEVVEAWRPVQYTPIQTTRDWISIATLIVWGKDSELMNKDGSLNKRTFDKVLEDLSEYKDTHPETK
jgi:hypothetical protein